MGLAPRRRLSISGGVGGGGAGGGSSLGGLLGGLLHFGEWPPPELTPEAGQGLSGRGNASLSAAVTAPTYVLEESLSSQHLWKLTAGNRPPQPAEERAFYEKIWAQNFLRSNALYEMPVEVLTATSPISLSPFADGEFGAAIGAGAGEEASAAAAATYSSEYRATAAQENGFRRGRPVGEGGGGGRSDSWRGGGSSSDANGNPAGSSPPEGTLMQRLGIAGAAQHYANPRGDYPRLMGPHRPRHTIVNRKAAKAGGGEHDTLTVVVRGDNVFGTTVSKSFERRDAFPPPTVCGRGGRGPSRHDPRSQTTDLRSGADTVSVSIASYRVVASRRKRYAQFLVIYCEGSFRDTVGVWKRYSDFDRLSKKISAVGNGESCSSMLGKMHPLNIVREDEEPEDMDEDFYHTGGTEVLPNAVMSWRLLKKRQRWFRCLDAEYLSLKVFLLERFLHDILFESSNPEILRDFVGDVGGGVVSSGIGGNGAVQI